MPIKIEIVPHEERFSGQVEAFNRRLVGGGIPFQFPTSHISECLPNGPDQPVSIEYFLAVENGAVRGGYGLKRQPFWIGGSMRPVGNVQLPLSEGIIDRAYGLVGIQLFVDAARRETLLYGTGMGGTRNPLVPILRAMRWTVSAVPCFVRVVHPRTFFRNIRHLRTTASRALLCDALATTGVGWAAVKFGQAIARGLHRAEERVTVRTLQSFPEWCDAMWEACRGDYRMVGVRDSATLDALYPAGSARFHRLAMWRDHAPVGWVVCLATEMREHRLLGTMKVGSIVDCLGHATHADAIMRAATSYLEHAGVDVIISNQGSRLWGSALRRAGYLPAPSNFALALSPQLAALVHADSMSDPHIHINRGDGEGPIHL